MTLDSESIGVPRPCVLASDLLDCDDLLPIGTLMLSGDGVWILCAIISNGTGFRLRWQKLTATFERAQ
jgi:hypothetical protein